jgi:hypothetical protein
MQNIENKQVIDKLFKKGELTSGNSRLPRRPYGLLAMTTRGGGAEPGVSWADRAAAKI